MFKVLVVEDDKDLNRAVCTFLRRNGYETVGSYDGEDAYTKMCDNVFDLVISDIMMPTVDGFELAETIRREDESIPIIFMTAKDDMNSKQLGYMLGIDDYLVKPVNFEELLLKIGAVLRRAKINNSKRLVVGGFVMDMDERSAILDGEEIPLTVREFNLLYKFLSYPKKTFTRTALMDEFWDADSLAGSRTVDVYMRKLREKFENCSYFDIVTVHGLGYKAVINEE